MVTLKKVEYYAPDDLVQLLRDTKIPLTKVAEKTEIPYPTLKNYRYGKTDADTMPHRMVMTLSMFFRQQALTPIKVSDYDVVFVADVEQVYQSMFGYRNKHEYNLAIMHDVAYWFGNPLSLKAESIYVITDEFIEHCGSIENVNQMLMTYFIGMPGSKRHVRLLIDVKYVKRLCVSDEIVVAEQYHESQPLVYNYQSIIPMENTFVEKTYAPFRYKTVFNPIWEYLISLHYAIDTEMLHDILTFIAQDQSRYEQFFLLYRHLLSRDCVQSAVHAYLMGHSLANIPVAEHMWNDTHDIYLVRTLTDTICHINQSLIENDMFAKVTLGVELYDVDKTRDDRYQCIRDYRRPQDNFPYNIVIKVSNVELIDPTNFHRLNAFDWNKFVKSNNVNTKQTMTVTITSTYGTTFVTAITFYQKGHKASKTITFSKTQD